MSIHNYQQLLVWQKAMDLVVSCYKASEGFPQGELYGLTSQLRRAAVSIPANIAEGRHRQHIREFIQHLSIAYGSLAELETHIYLAERLGFMESPVVQTLLQQTSEIGKMLNGLKKSLHARAKT